MIIKRYLIKEAVKSQLNVLLVLLAILISQHFVRFLGDAADGDIPATFILQLVTLKLPEVILLVLPFSLFLGILFCHGRMYNNNEMTALHGSGISEAFVTKAMLQVALVNMLIFCALSFYVKPWAHYKIEELYMHMDANTSISSLSPGRFIQTGNDDTVIFIENIDQEHHLKTIFVAHQRNEHDGTKHHVMMAKEGSLVDTKSGAQELHLEHGTRYTANPKQLDLNLTQFMGYQMQLMMKPKTVDQKISMLSLRELKEMNTPLALGLYHWSISMPLMIPILTLLAVPLARVNTRQGKFAKLVPALVIYISYFLCFMTARRAIEQSLYPSDFGLWWVHIIVFILALILLYQTRISHWLKIKTMRLA